MQGNKFYKKFLQSDGSFIYKGYKIWMESSIDEYQVMNMLFNCIEFYTKSLDEAFDYVDSQDGEYNEDEY